MAFTYNGLGGKSPKWWPSRYGAEDTQGSGNEITPERILRALAIPRMGLTLKLAQTSRPGIRGVGSRSWQMVVLAHESLASSIAAGGDNELSALEDFVSSSSHIGCHLDGLGHIGIAGVHYNGVPYGDIYSPEGLSKYGISDVFPFVTRGICLDIAAVLNVDRLPGGFAIEREHLIRACELQGVSPEPGDAVLIHTGWGDLWTDDPETYAQSEPGISWDAAHWLTEHRPSLLGADNWALEVVPFEQPSKFFWVHQHVVAETGTHIIENISTRPLVSGGHNIFLFMLSMPQIEGATAAIASPIAIV